MSSSTRARGKVGQAGDSSGCSPQGKKIYNLQHARVAELNEALAVPQDRAPTLPTHYP